MVTEQHIEQVANMARLKLSEEEQKTFCMQLNQLLEYATALDQVDLTAEKTDELDEYKKRPYREDVVVPSLPRERLLSNAPDEEDGFFKVPSVLD